MIFNLISQGGPVFMIPLVLLLILILFLLGTAFVNNESKIKSKELVSSLSLFAVVWGVLGQVIGLIAGFDVIEATGSVSPSVLAGGLKVSFIPLAFGLVIYLIARLGIILLVWRAQESA
ncbi:MAG: hypothetical protein ACI9FN_000656 [Saprospiraceae bacterium]|jgi:hypothetical protein